MGSISSIKVKLTERGRELDILHRDKIRDTIFYFFIFLAFYLLEFSQSFKFTKGITSLSMEKESLC